MKTKRRKFLIAGMLLALAVARTVAGGSSRLAPGDHLRHVTSGERERTYRIHIPSRVSADEPAPVVLALHGAGMNGASLIPFSGLNAKADAAGFIAVYPDGTGLGPFLTWNAGSFPGGRTGRQPDDVAFIAALLDDLATVVVVDTNRVYACGLSNGAMMCYRLAAELSERIAAIAPIAGTIAIRESRPVRPVSVIHFHGTEDRLVPYAGLGSRNARSVRLASVEDSIWTWVEINHCQPEPAVDTLSKEGDRLKVTRRVYRGGTEGAEVVLITIEGGGHTWPGQQPKVRFLGKSATNIAANDLLWDFFQRHPRNPTPHDELTP